QPGVLELAGETLDRRRVLHLDRALRRPAPEGELGRLGGQTGERQGRGELLLQAAEDGVGGLGEGRLELAADPRVASPEVVRLWLAEVALPEELEIAVHQGEAVDGVAQVELGEGALVEGLEEAGRRERLGGAAGRGDERR